MKKVISTLAATMIAATSSLAMLSTPNSYAAIEDYSEEELAQIRADMVGYLDEIAAYGDQFGYTNGRFFFPNIKYFTRRNTTDMNWQAFCKNSSNVQAAFINEDKYAGCTASGLCLGISMASILAHNGVISPSDIQEGKETLLDIEADTVRVGTDPDWDQIIIEPGSDTDRVGIHGDPVISKILSYQTRQLAPDFQLDMYYHFAHYDKERDVDHLLETARKSTEQGKWWLIGYDDVGFTHAVAGIGLVEGEFKLGSKTYDNCILTYDSNCVNTDPETDEYISAAEVYPNGCLYVNSETREVFVPAYFLDDLGSDFKVYTLDDEDFMNYKGVMNPSSSYETDVSSLCSVEVRCTGEHSIDAVRADGSEYDVKASCGKTFGNAKGIYTKTCYFCDGERFNIQNKDVKTKFIADFMDTRQLYCTSFNGKVNNVFKGEDEFGFDTLGNTSYDITLAFEEGCYDFAPHYRYDFSGMTDGDFKAVQTDRGIILSGKNGVQCSLKTSDVTRDENGLIVSAEDNVHNEGIFASESVMISFVDNKPKYFIGENYDEEVQKGDVNCDGTIDPGDASLVLNGYASLATGGTTYLNYGLADWDADGELNPLDASFILSRYAELATIK